ncbi:pre-mrna-processing protein 45 [Phaffia rhodozyma]|uniref:Pre-mRNA-processing protein 45 n=1 Tax=Phaffia rhodozyma TaxID=264483 RepID=A0A0F7SJZ5_PHARH|nr:pre-mrna-processing protein 45 [Phaffia rhodozyma]
MAALANLLPTPRFSSAPTPTYGHEEDTSDQPSSSALTILTPAKPYGSRRGWRPSRPEDFADGGAYPECPVAQYPLDLGRKKGGSGNTLALQVDSDGNVNYGAIAQQGQREGKNVQSSFKDLVPIAQRTDLSTTDRSLERPSEEEVMNTAERTRLALEKLSNTKIKAAQPSRVADSQGNTSYVRYTPAQQGSSNANQRIIKMTEVVEDPLQPARFKAKKIPRGPPSPPPPVLRSPPRKATAQEQKDWMIPPCISNWKNNKGYTIPLDKRLAADGRGLQDVHINDNFAKFSEALFVADRHAREEVRQRSLMQQKLAQKEKAAKEEHLRLLAQRARDDRAGITTAATPALPSKAVEKGMGGALGGYGSESGSGSDSDSDSDSEKSKGGDDEEDAEEIRIREKLRREQKQEREREMRMQSMGNEQRAKMIAKEQNRDISEKIALGLAKPSANKETMIDSRLFNRESLSGSFASDDAYNLYDKPLFHGSAAAAAIYKPLSSSGQAAGEETYGGGTEDGVVKNLQNDRFSLGVSHRFEGTESVPGGESAPRDGPVQFEKDTTATIDPFGLDQFLDDAKKGNKRGGLELSEKAKGKRARREDE